MKTRKVVSPSQIESASPNARSARPVKRRCPLCDRVFVLNDRSAVSTLVCPTRNCRGTPDIWVHPGDPLTSEEAWHDWERMAAAWNASHRLDDDLAA